MCGPLLLKDKGKWFGYARQQYSLTTHACYLPLARIDFHMLKQQQFYLKELLYLIRSIINTSYLCSEMLFSMTVIGLHMLKLYQSHVCFIPVEINLSTITHIATKLHSYKARYNQSEKACM